MTNATLTPTAAFLPANGQNGHGEYVGIVNDRLTIPWNERSLNGEQTVGLLVSHALRMKASDLFFSSNENEIVVTVRQLGIIKTIASLPVALGRACISNLRAMSSMNFVDRKHPQDGRWVFNPGNGPVVDLRLNALPTLHGEAIAIRILERGSHLQNLESLGFEGPQLGTVVSMMQSNSGLILVTGPTGSGKTTTMYACLHYLNDGRRKIHTIEDPVEYSVLGLHQTQVDAAHGGDFADMLRGIIRQGPDVIMIGEVRDRPTAETAVRAANSGQLVFASLHASVAATAIQSILNLGVSSYFLCTSLLGVICQRLARTLPIDSRVPIDLSGQPDAFDEVRPWLEQGHRHIAYAAAGDSQPNEGYIGRIGVFEVMSMTPTIRRLVGESRPASEIQTAAVDEGMLDFRRAALLKVAHGFTSFDEMQRILPTGDTWMDD